jgi:hypothetical protein
MQSCQISCYFLSLMSKYSPQHPALKHTQPMFINVGVCFTPTQNSRKNLFCIFNVYILDGLVEDKRFQTE